MADKYEKVVREQEKLADNEIRVRRGNAIGKYLKRANDILTGKVEGNFDSVTIKGVANAMENAVRLAEMIKHRVPGLYQLNHIGTIEIKDEYEPLEEGLDHLVFSRFSTMLTIILSLKPLDNRDIGYQDPIPTSDIVPYEDRPTGAGGRSRRQSFAGSENNRGTPRSNSRRRSPSANREGGNTGRGNNRDIFRGQRGGGQRGGGQRGGQRNGTPRNDNIEGSGRPQSARGGRRNNNN